MRSSGHYVLDNAIQRYGYNHFRSKLGQPLLQESPGQYTDVMLKEWVASIVLSHGRVPKQTELRKIDSRKQGAITHRGGVTTFLQELAVEQPVVFEPYLVEFMNRNGGRRKKCHKKNL